MAKVLLITMGGTIDAAPYSEKDGEYPVNATMTGENRAAVALKDIFCEKAPVAKTEIYTFALCDKDSKDVDRRDRDALRTIVLQASKRYDRIIVTMGTDRMCETAQDIAGKVERLGCPVVFTGAIWPLANGKKSDGWHNLTSAAFANDNVGQHVYIAMGGVFARAERMKKDFERREFVEAAAPLPSCL